MAKNDALIGIGLGLGRDFWRDTVLRIEEPDDDVMAEKADVAYEQQQRIK